MNNLLSALNETVINRTQSKLIGPLDFSSKSEHSIVIDSPTKLPLGTLLYVKNKAEKLELLAYIYRYENQKQIALILNKNVDESSFNSGIFASKETLNFHFLPTHLGCLIDPRGRIIKRITKAKGFQLNRSILSYKGSSPNPCDRQEISKVFYTRIGVIDVFNTIGFGQKIAILAEPGVGKTTLITDLLINSIADINIITLVGERGREINEFITALPEETMCKSIVIMSTSDDTAASRILAVEAAISLAEHFRELGFNVLLEIDSFTRFLRAFRELSLELGELPISHGFSASVYPTIARLLERVGNSRNGSITTFFTLLTSTDLVEEPLVKEIISLSDGHLYLSKSIANNGLYPAVDISNSLSRLQTRLLSKKTLEMISELRKNILKIEKIKSHLSLGIKINEKQEMIIKQESKLSSIYSAMTSNLDQLNEVIIAAYT